MLIPVAQARPPPCIAKRSDMPSSGVQATQKYFPSVLFVTCSCDHLYPLFRDHLVMHGYTTHFNLYQLRDHLYSKTTFSWPTRGRLMQVSLYMGCLFYCTTNICQKKDYRLASNMNGSIPSVVTSLFSLPSSLFPFFNQSVQFTVL